MDLLTTIVSLFAVTIVISIFLVVTLFCVIYAILHLEGQDK